MYRIGIDLGGTKIEGVVLDPAGIELFRQRIPTEQELGYEHILSNIKKIYHIMSDHIGGDAHSIGLGAPGAVSHRTGVVKKSNTLCLNKKPLKDDLEKMFGREVEVQNDANCFALAEALSGAATDGSLVFGVIMGTGCGGGIVYNGSVINGRQDIAGEWGHTSIDPEGPLCYCGSRGCVETYISGAGLERLYESQFSERVVLKDIVNRYRENDYHSVRFMEHFFKRFGRALANLINVLDPDVIVIGGGVSNIDEIYTKGVEEVRKQVFSDSLETSILKNRLGDSAGVIGAALIGR
ncbi:N-acetylglucosamine kinase [Candidatus Scalindua japonica]|uniref:N-acetylglucosamine kinase n=1 Tax=Candidatus Scalindua japonica TaxID=1284222 RepID=A0A286U000_9BACT|nr:ROK family protein [Candidatus Scalindua japonica]GAX61462.1 N-acetylglucosamine kinase [Candidatus Scalindua japonica]